MGQTSFVHKSVWLRTDSEAISLGFYCYCFQQFMIALNRYIKISY